MREIFSGAFIEVWSAFMSFLPMVCAAVFILAVGMLLGRVLGSAVTRLLTALKLNQALASAGFGDLAEKIGCTLRVSEWLGSFVRWFVNVVFFIAAINVLGLDTVTYFLEDVVYGFVPKLCVAVLIMGTAFVIGEFVRKIITKAVATMGTARAGLLGSAAEWSIIIFALFAALSELGIAEDLIRILFSGIVVAFSLALGLSFGIGGQHAAAELLEDVKQKHLKK
jgi:hypothetical protein